MTYKQLRNQLKTFKSQGLTTIALNAKKDILETEYNRIMNAIVKEAINSEYEDNEDVTIANDTEDLIKEVSALEIASEDLVNEIVVNPPLELIEDCSREPSPENKFNLVNETIETITPENKELSLDDCTVKSNDNEAFEDLTESKEGNYSEVSITESTLSNLEDTDKKLTEALVKLIVIFVSSIVKIWFKVNRISQLSKAILGKVNEARADIKGYWQWFISGFCLPSFN
ncbi:hypothetical protein ACN4EE_18060 [Geminocystis sp. CENA526]|uniref:hypothetical protein n=1 Tax=Geminocystis sp. CENA526 TaxID=1355871 RepID=UPI003D6EB159